MALFVSRNSGTSSLSHLTTTQKLIHQATMLNPQTDITTATMTDAATLNPPYPSDKDGDDDFDITEVNEDITEIEEEEDEGNGVEARMLMAKVDEHDAAEDDDDNDDATMTASTAVIVVQSKEDEEQRRLRLAKLVDSWSTKEQQLAEEQAERERIDAEEEIINDDDGDDDDVNKEQKAERIRLARLVLAWDKGHGPKSLLLVDSLASAKENGDKDNNDNKEDYPTFEVPTDYVPTILDASREKNKSTTRTTISKALVDGPRLTFSSLLWEQQQNHDDNNDATEAVMVVQSKEDEEQRRLRLAKLVDSWSTKKQQLAEEQAKRERIDAEEEIVKDDGDDDDNKEQKAEQIRLARLVLAWDKGHGPKSLLLVDSLASAKENADNNHNNEDYPTFDLPEDYVPTILDASREKNKSTTRTTITKALVDGPRLTFSLWEQQQNHDVTISDSEEEERARLAALVDDWSPAESSLGKDGTVDQKRRRRGVNTADDELSPEEKEERARLAEKVELWSKGGDLYLLSDTISTSPTFDNDMSEDGEEHHEEEVPPQEMTAEDLERLRFAKMVDAWATGYGSYHFIDQKKHDNSTFPVYSFDDVLMEEGEQDEATKAENRERLRLQKLVDNWMDDETMTSSSKTDAWERFQMMMRAEEEKAARGGKTNGAGCLCFRVVPHRQSALA